MGEKQGDREIIDRNTRDLIASNVRPDVAKRMARESMERVDRKLRNEGKR